MKTVLVTGASAGIGAEFAREFHRLGYSVILLARREDKLQALSDELNSIRAESASYRVVDLSKMGTDKPFQEWLVEQDIDVLVSNAGFGSFGEFFKLDLDREVEMVELNIVANQRLVHACLPNILRKGSGGIIVVSSIAALAPVSFMATYCATKAFDHSFALALHEELKGRGVTVTSVCPGPVDTEFAGVARVSFAGGPRVLPSLVAKQSVKAFLSGKAQVFPHWSAKILRLVISILPRSLSLSFTAFMMRRILREAQAKVVNENEGVV